jgi:predicted methyltransferase
VIWASDTYHDLHNKAFGSPDMSRVNTTLLAALKPGGLLLIEAHAGVMGSRARQQVRQEVTQAGFEFAGELRDGEHAMLKFRKP